MVAHRSSLVPRLHSPAFYCTAFIHSAIKSWGVESGNEATSKNFHIPSHWHCTFVLAKNDSVRASHSIIYRDDPAMSYRFPFSTRSRGKLGSKGTNDYNYPKWILLRESPLSSHRFRVLLAAACSFSITLVLNH